MDECCFLPAKDNVCIIRKWYSYLRTTNYKHISLGPSILSWEKNTSKTLLNNIYNVERRYMNYVEICSSSEWVGDTFLNINIHMYVRSMKNICINFNWIFNFDSCIMLKRKLPKAFKVLWILKFISFEIKLIIESFTIHIRMYISIHYPSIFNRFHSQWNELQHR